MRIKCRYSSSYASAFLDASCCTCEVGRSFYFIEETKQGSLEVRFIPPAQKRSMAPRESRPDAARSKLSLIHI